MSQNLMQKLLMERTKAQKEAASLKTSKSEQTQLILALYDKMEKMDKKLDQLLSRPVGSVLLKSDNEQIIKGKTIESESEPAPFIPSIDTEDMVVKGNTTTSKTSKRSISDNVSGLKDLSGA